MGEAKIKIIENSSGSQALLVSTSPWHAGMEQSEAGLEGPGRQHEIVPSTGVQRSTISHVEKRQRYPFHGLQYHLCAVHLNGARGS